jgi:hypothetical protein
MPFMQPTKTAGIVPKIKSQPILQGKAGRENTKSNAESSAGN